MKKKIKIMLGIGIIVIILIMLFLNYSMYFAAFKSTVIMPNSMKDEFKARYFEAYPNEMAACLEYIRLGNFVLLTGISDAEDVIATPDDVSYTCPIGSAAVHSHPDSICVPSETDTTDNRICRFVDTGEVTDCPQENKVDAIVCGDATQVDGFIFYDLEFAGTKQETLTVAIPVGTRKIIVTEHKD